MVKLERRLTTTSATLFGLSYICPTVVVSTYGVIQAATHGAAAWVYILASVAIVLSASSYGRMAARYPQSGSAYTYVSCTTNSTIGFVIGWALLLDYVFIPMVICLFTAKAVEIVLPAYSFKLWIPVIAAFTTVVNMLGIKVADRVNIAIMVLQLIAMGALVVLCLIYIISQSHGAAVWQSPVPAASAGIGALLGGTAIASYSFLGFDAVTTLSEEAIDPARSIPRATVLAPIIGGLIFATTAYLLYQVRPDSSFRDLDSAGFDVFRQAAGSTFLTIFTLVLIVSYVAAVLCAQAGSARLLFAMGRSGVLPRRFFAYLHPRWRTPILALLLMGLFTLIGEFIDVETAASCVNFGAFMAFMSVNICVLLDHFRSPPQLRLNGGLAKLLTAGLGAIAAFSLLLSLSRTAHLVGLVWLAIGIVYTLWRSNWFSVAIPFVQIDADETEGTSRGL